MRILDQAFRLAHFRKRMLLACGLVLMMSYSCLYGCDQSNSGQASAQSTAQVEQYPILAQRDPSTPAKPAQLPEPSQVLYAIYHYASDASSSFSMDNGSIVNYWYGYQFQLKGEHYFTGFANSTAPSDAQEMMQQAGHVAISQATFVASNSSGKATWKAIDSDGYIGEFGRMDQPYNIDTRREALSYPTMDGKLLLAVPTQDFKHGITTALYALFVFDSEKNQTQGKGLWQYVGSVLAGSDNSESCENGGRIQCLHNSGKLSFEPNSGTGLPTIKLQFSGTDLSQDAQIRQMGARDVVRYRYDAEQNAYRSN